MSFKPTKETYQKRGILVTKLVYLLELSQKESVASILSVLFSPIGEKIHPFKWDDNTLLGKIEKEIELAENPETDE